jgi:hypothetical protein
MVRIRAYVLVCGALALSFDAGRTLAQPQWLMGALVSLQGATNELEKLPPDAAGHRERALAHIAEAMKEVNATIDYLRF